MLLRLTILLSSLICATTQSCYYPNGNNATSDTECAVPGSGDGFCCSNSYYCLSNKLCQWEDGRLYRGSCTDEDWSSGNCPGFCKSDTPGNGVRLFQCSISAGTYCCAANNSQTDTCCNDSGVQLLTLGVGSTIGQIVATGFSDFRVSSTSSTTSTTTTSSSSSTSSTSSISSTTSTSSPSNSATSSPSPTTGTTGTTSTTGTADGASATSSGAPTFATSSSSSSIAGPVAGGVVGGLLVIGGLIFTAWFIRHRRKAAAARGAAEGAPHGAPTQEPKKDLYSYGGYYQSAPQHEPREMDGNSQFIPQELDSSGGRSTQAAPNWHELPADQEYRHR